MSWPQEGLLQLVVVSLLISNRFFSVVALSSGVAPDSSTVALVAAREHVDLHPVAHELLRQLAGVARQPALDDRRVLPGDQQDARDHDR